MWKLKNNKKSTTIDSNILTIEVLTLIKNKLRRQRVNLQWQKQPYGGQSFCGISSKHSRTDWKRKKIIFSWRGNGQIYLSTDTLIETVEKDLFETLRVVSTREWKATNTNNKSASTKECLMRVRSINENGEKNLEWNDWWRQRKFWIEFGLLLDTCMMSIGIRSIFIKCEI